MVLAKKAFKWAYERFSKWKRKWSFIFQKNGFSCFMRMGNNLPLSVPFSIFFVSVSGQTFYTFLWLKLAVISHATHNNCIKILKLHWIIWSRTNACYAFFCIAIDIFIAFFPRFVFAWKKIFSVEKMLILSIFVHFFVCRFRYFPLYLSISFSLDKYYTSSFSQAE